MAAIGAQVQRTETGDALARARQRAALLPDLLVEARRILNTVNTGWHGRRKSGVGESFWQFRPYTEGEAVSRIDWRRSARDDRTYIRDQEWEAAHTVWLWADPSPSMLYKSEQAHVSKESRALVLVLALAELLSRSGERIGFPGITDPSSARNGAERLATLLSHATSLPPKPDLTKVRRFSDVVLVSDFLEPVEETLAVLQRLAHDGARAHLIEVYDPAEEEFPYKRRTEFIDPETGASLTFGRAQDYAEDYRRLFHARRDTLSAFCKRIGWSYTTNRTDRLASDALVSVHMNMTANIGYQGGGL
ncbi:DUF58 domain-containing protein [Phyllobacterium zundukense]|uniref:DUF58 domain-containing protein n=1 Tax=Phyllobacterium zundukense TaxID=1867719 RepID=A0A2N9VZF7_9HYPH|nr:DUF58 domain-containing protein [Phyllobacterium zundukense]ATU90872.1 hypothetical protein BLM14_03900 [Phyllobacterium zundukense]PIO44875.1 DUF58 domain-containing protein [Phyllobacterium zundukense]